MPYTFVFLDFDNLLLDSDGWTVWYIKETYRDFGFKVPSTKRIHALRGLKIYDVFKQLSPNLTKKQIELLFKRSKYFSRKAWDKMLLFPPTKEVLRYLSKKYTLGLVTSRYKKSTHYLLKRFHIKKYFKAVITAEDVKKSKPHPEPLLKCMKMLRAPKHSIVYVGDSKNDRKSAKRAGLDFIYLSGKHLQQLKKKL